MIPRRALCFLFLLLAASLAPGQETDDYAEALRLYRAGQFDESARLLERTIETGQAHAAHHALLGWCRLRSSDASGAEEAFARAAELDPHAVEPVVGQGFVALRQGRGEEAKRHFTDAVERERDNAEAWKGLGLAQHQLAELKAARESFQRAVAMAPDDAEARRLLDENLLAIVEERRPRSAVEPERPVKVDVRARAGRFEVAREGSWKPLFVKGVNLGTALPGSFPAEFPDDEALYRQWFDLMGEMGLNTVRLYTLHPPSLYRALAAHNRERPQQKLWLVQGAWTGLPPGDDFDDPDFAEGFKAEIRRVIDAVHGNLELPPRPGHADGVYDADVSGDLLVWVLGREWEPFSVDAYHRARPGRTSFEGRYVRAENALPIEAWLASICETAVEHETEYYGRQHPVGYTSWPTLDPLVHPTEATVAEEMEIRKRMGETDVELIREYDNDKVNVDSMRLRASAGFPAGLFAAYHAYPYYPEFMVLDPGYAQVRDGEGVSRYLGYLQELKRHHGDQPVLIAELGVPTSRGIAHLQPEGQHHGGHNSRAQAAINARLMRNIHQAGLAGGILFAWMDEWFKRNWLVMNYESPPARNRLWLNALDAEQNYGLLAALPGEDGPRVVLDGKAGDWSEVPPLYEGGGPLRALRVTSDEAYLYLLLEAGAGGWHYRVGIDTYDARRGSHRFPDPLEVRTAIGLEFLVELGGEEGGRILVDRPYDLFSNRKRRPYRSVENDRGDFVEIVTFTNRDRYGRDGTYYPPKGYSRSPLRFGSTDPASPVFDDLADWFAGPGRRVVELRIPWGLLNVADPSSRRVIHEQRETEGIVETAMTDGFRFHVLALRGSADDPKVVDAFPPDGGARVEDYPSYLWPGWERPSYRLELKPSYSLLRDALARIGDVPRTPGLGTSNSR